MSELGLERTVLHLGRFLELQVLLLLEQLLDEEHHLLLGHSSIPVLINRVEKFLHLLVTQCQVRKGHLSQILLDFVEFEGSILVEVVEDPDFLNLGDDSDVSAGLGLDYFANVLVHFFFIYNII